MRSAALLVTFAAVVVSAVAAASGGADMTGCAGAPGCRLTRTELLPGRTVRCVSPATTSIFTGGNTVRVVVVTPGAGGAGGACGAEALAAAATRCFGLATAGLAVSAVGCTGATLAGGVLSAGCSDSASVISSGAPGNQKSRLAHTTITNASSSRQRDPIISFRCFGS